MIDLSQFWSVGGLAVLVAVLIQVGKTGPLAADARKPWIPYVAMGLGVGLAVLIGWATGKLGVPADWVSAGIGGILSGLSATGFYEATVGTGKRLLGS